MAESKKEPGLESPLASEDHDRVYKLACAAIVARMATQLIDPLDETEVFGRLYRATPKEVMGVEVYREFKDIDQFMDELKALARERREK